MVVIGTREAFLELISQKGFAAKYGVDKTLVSQWKKGTRIPTIDKMETVLQLAGAVVVQEKVWDIDGKGS